MIAGWLCWFGTDLWCLWWCCYSDCGLHFWMVWVGCCVWMLCCFSWLGRGCFVLAYAFWFGLMLCFAGGLMVGCGLLFWCCFSV